MSKAANHDINPSTSSENRKPITLINSADLAVSCPPNEMPLWDKHPKVYLEFDQSGQASCPYCGAQYQIEENEIGKSSN